MDIERKRNSQLTFWLDKQVLNTLEDYVLKYEGTNKSSVARQALIEFLEREKTMRMVKETIEGYLGG